MNVNIQRQQNEMSCVARKLRLIDNIPTRSELIQSERRFVELYDESALRLDETRKYFSIYNTLEDKLKFMEKEVVLIDSIGSNFHTAISNPAASAAYLKQLNEINFSMEQTLQKQKLKLIEKTNIVDTLDSKHQMLLDQQRTYLKCIKQLQQECDRNEELFAQLKEASLL